MAPFLLLAACRLSAPGQERPATDTVIVGEFISNRPMDYVADECPADSICLRSWWKSAVRVDRVLRGPPLGPRVSSGSMQHTGLNEQYRRAVNVFVLHPIVDADLRAKLRVGYLLDIVGIRRPDGRYCLNEEPGEYGLTGTAERDADGQYCLALTGR